MNCRFCSAPVSETFVDLGLQPLANSYVPAEMRDQPELFYPLHVRVCGRCLLVQLPEVVRAENIFTDYAYLSSASKSWLEHCQAFARQMAQRLGLSAGDSVVELASNDGYLLRYFLELGLDVLGVEPARNIAAIAESNGIPTLPRFFGKALAAELCAERARPKLLIANNVLAHVPDINDFVAGLKVLLSPRGVLSVEFPHVLELIDKNQFDTIYHEHFSYLSLGLVRKLFAAHGLRVFDVERLSTHGGSLRVLSCHADDDSHGERPGVEAVALRESEAGLTALEGYRHYTERVEKTKWALVSLLSSLRQGNKRVVGYGAPAKGNTLLNYCGIRSDLLTFTVDKNHLKQGKLLPGTRIPIYAPEMIAQERPDFVLILPWNLRREITEQLAEVRAWGGKFIVPIPEPRILA